MQRTEINTPQLREVLASFAEELKVGFLERRSKEQSHKQSPLDELSDVVKELTDRERQLQASVGISSMLLDNNELLSQELEKLRGKTRTLKERNRLLQGELNIFQEDIQTSNEKYSRICEELFNTEEQLLSLNTENKRLLKAISSESNSVHETNDSSIEDIKTQYSCTVEMLKKENVELQRTVKNLTDTVEDLENSNEFLSNHLEKSKKESQSLKERANELDCQVKTLDQRAKNCEDKLKSSEIAHRKALRQSKALEEELAFAQKATNFKEQSQEHSGLSLMEELENLELDGSTLESESDREKEKERNNKISENFGAIYLPSYSKKDVCEEYFMLAAQSIKLNSAYMDAINSVPINLLYKKAINLEIPFHKWYDWIQNELNSVYINKLYQRDLKQKAPSKVISH